MIIPTYQIRQSDILGAGKGVYLSQDVKKGSVIVFPDGIRPDQVFTLDKLNEFPADSAEQDSSVRWFENYFTINLEWTDECYINHSFTPTGLWHLGFIFAFTDLKKGCELTIDYRFIIPEGEEMPFKDGQTGLPIIGYSWKDILGKSMESLKQII